MFAGITNLLWGSSVPTTTPAPEEPAVIDNDLCPMEVGSDTGCSDEEMVHLPKPNSDGEEDWVVVTEGRSGKKEAPIKKQQGDALRSGDQFMTEDPEKSKDESAKVLRVESKIRNREPKAWNLVPKRVSPEPALVLPLPKKVVMAEDRMKKVERKFSVHDAHKNSSVETAVVEIEPKLAQVEQKMEKMNLSRMRVEQKRGRVESKLKNTDAKRVKGEPKIIEAKTDIEITETETVEEVDVKYKPEIASVQPKLVTDELELVEARSEIVPAKPELVVETMPEMIETRSKSVIMPEIGSTETKIAIIKEQMAKDQSEHDDTGFQLVHSRRNRYNCRRGAKTRKEAIELYLRQCEEESVIVARAVPDKMRIESKTNTEETPMMVESEEVKVDVIEDKADINIDGAESMVYTADTTEIDTKLKSVSPAIKSLSRRQRRTRFRNTLSGNHTSENYEKHLDQPRKQEKTRSFARYGFSMCSHKKTRTQASPEDYLELDDYMVAPLLENRSKPRPIDEDIRELLEYARLDVEIPESSPTPSPHFWPFGDMPMTRRAKVNYIRMMMNNPFATPSDLVDQDAELLCNMLNDKRRKPSEVEGGMRLLNAKLKDRREEMEKELHFNKEHEARAAENELKKEEQRQETRLTQKAIRPVEHRRLSRKNIQKSNAAHLMSSAGNGRLRRSDRLHPRHASGANNNRKCC